MFFEQDGNKIVMSLCAEDEYKCPECEEYNGAYEVFVSNGKPAASFACGQCKTSVTIQYDVVVAEEIKHTFWRSR
jgi:hypothetical protein